MNDMLREQFVSIINVNKPSLKLIDKHMFDAIERYHNCLANENKKIKACSSRSSNFAATVQCERDKFEESENVNELSCSLFNGNHPYYKCDKFKSPIQKVERLKKLNG